MADFGGTELEAFRAEVREWLAQNYPAELRDPNAKTDPEAIWAGRAFEGSDDPQVVWMRRVASRGWTTPSWPEAYGGGGLSAAQAKVLDQELAA
ncbi:MAG TPA: acyl-CoA dehydrogenase family protein, partial [Caulobacteraceae bacterium]|nr:acyl-CoA dehydrogenase family protein [Caulobacteraceae bacterium]